jgi:hypothetical protein
MAENNVGDEQVDGISRRLAELQERLSPEEVAMLSGIFSVAADTIRPSGDGRGRTGLVSEGGAESSATVQTPDTAAPIAEQFRQQFLGAFAPDPPEPAHTLSSMIIPARPGIIPARPNP